MSGRITYLDNNATTRPADEVVAAMLPMLAERWGNPSSAHHFGAQVAAEVEDARRHVAGAINARPAEVVFTAGGTEADNAALRGTLAAQPDKRHIVISTVEHHAIFETAEALEREGVEVSQISVDRDGQLDLDGLRAAIRDDTAVVSIMLANNETGVIFPLDQVSQIAHERGVLVHTDAVNALGKIPVDVDSLGVDLLSLSAHKIYGPKGVGALYLRRGTPYRPWQIGGSQERGRRGGTLNTPGIVGLGAACKLIVHENPDTHQHIAEMRNRLETEIVRNIPTAQIVGTNASRLPNTACICFAGVPSEPIVILLSESGVCVSSGSACTSGSLEPSHVLQAMGIEPEVGQGEIRFSLGRYTQSADIDRVLDLLPAVLEKVSASGLQ